MDDRTSAPGLPSDGYKMAAESRPFPVAPQSNNKPTLAVCNSVRVDLCALSCDTLESYSDSMSLFECTAYTKASLEYFTGGRSLVVSTM
ncbi:hypothetical protein Q1695_013354 [Nippostrongylus brasiliensis]|nr:hypothetical protein Q1695_013354 [Nippostrongylus brasiliensis]